MTRDAKPAAQEVADGGTADQDERASFFREGVDDSRRALTEFRRRIEATILTGSTPGRALVAVTIGVGLAYVYEYFVAAAAQLAGTSPASLSDVLTLKLTTHDLLLGLLLLVYLDLFVSFVALKGRSRERPSHHESGPETERAGGGLSRKWWAVNMLAGCAAGYLLFVAHGTFAAGLGAGTGLFLGDELYRRARAGGL